MACLSKTNSDNIGDTENKYIVKASELSFGVYLIHGIILDLIMKYYPYKNINSFIGVPSLLVAILLSAGVIIALVRKSRFISAYL